MSAFSNPFAQVGDYQVQRSPEDELVTTSYLTGLPDPRQIQNQHVALIFRTLLKRDTRTKQRALGELEQWIDGVSSENAIEDAVHLSYIQVYAKLSIDAAPLIRVQSHAILAKLYALLGKRSSKYLKYSVGPWIAAINDPDPRAATAAKNALARIFPGDKEAVLIEKMKEHILSFVYDSCSSASAQTLSDERYVSKEDASQKYTRLVKCCIDLLARVPGMFDLSVSEIESLVSSGRLWKFYSSSDSSLARSTLQLTMAHVSELEPYASVVWQELLRAGRRASGGAGVAIEVVQLMNVFTKRYPSITWPDDSFARKDAMVSLAQFVSTDPPHPARFWPLLYNLALTIPEPPTRDLSPLYKPLEKVVMKIKNDFELGRSAWGCFVSLAAKMGPEYVQRAFKAAEQRCKLKAVPIDILATFLARFAETEGVHALVKSQLEKDSTPFAYCRVIAQTHKFRSDVESLTVPRSSPDQLALLVEDDPDLGLPETAVDVAASAQWVTIAARSNTVNSQRIVEEALTVGDKNLTAILENAPALVERGVRVSLDSSIPSSTEESTMPVLRASISAHDTFVTRETSIKSFKLLLRRAQADEVAARDIFRVIRENEDFVNSFLETDSDARHDLETLKTEDKLGILRRLPAMKSENLNARKADVNPAALRALSLRDLSTLDLAVPLPLVSELRATVPVCTRPVNEALAEAEKLVEGFDSVLQSDHIGTEELVQLLVLRSFAQDWLLVALKSKSLTLSHFIRSLDDYMELAQPSKELWQHLWALLDGDNYSVAYHAAKELSSRRWAGSFPEDCFDRKYFSKPTLQGALLALHQVCRETQEYENIQRSLSRRVVAHNLDKKEWMLVDRHYIQDLSVFTLRDEELQDPELTCMILGTLPQVENRLDLALHPSDSLVQLVALRTLQADTSPDLVLNASKNLPLEKSNLDKQKAYALLRVLNNVVTNSRSAAINDWTVVQELLSRRDSDFLPWMALVSARSQQKTELWLNLENSHQSPLVRADIVNWLIYLNYMPSGSQFIASHEVHLRILDFVARNLRQNDGELIGQDHLHEPRSLPHYDMEDDDNDANLLYQMCVQHASDVREWYRNLRDRQTQRYVDAALATHIVPELIASIKTEIDSTSLDDAAEITVNRKQREVRASREVEDEFTVEVVISLPEQYPGKPASIEIRNLAGVSEAKKRGWLLEARQNVQNEGVLKALKGILTRLNNFLEGVEPCAICYSTVNDANKLPNRECGQCHNIYHSECLYKWFSTNNNKLCPMCRSPM